jgi:hypothetical protein
MLTKNIVDYVESSSADHILVDIQKMCTSLRRSVIIDKLFDPRIFLLKIDHETIGYLDPKSKKMNRKSNQYQLVELNS